MGTIRAGLLLLLTACGGAQPVVNGESSPAPSQSQSQSAKPVATSAPAPNPEYGPKLAEARRIRDEILAKGPPAFTSKSKEQSLRFVNTKLKDWYTDVRPRVDADESAYSAAFDVATTEFERGTALNELAEIQLTFVERALSSGTNAMPPEWKRDAELSTVYKDGLYSGFEPYVVRARKVIAHCKEVASGSCTSAQNRLVALEQSAPRG